MPIKNIIRECLLLTATAVLLAVLVNSISPAGIPWVADHAPSQCMAASTGSDSFDPAQFEIEDPFRLKALLDGGHALLVDARATDFYLNGHIRGAVSLPLSNVENGISVFKKDHPLETGLITYCYSPGCAAAFQLADRLMNEGYADVRVYVGGYDQWVKEGLPIE